MTLFAIVRLIFFLFVSGNNKNNCFFSFFVNGFLYRHSLLFFKWHEKKQNIGNSGDGVKSPPPTTVPSPSPHSSFKSPTRGQFHEAQIQWITPPGGITLNFNGNFSSCFQGWVKILLKKDVILCSTLSREIGPRSYACPIPQNLSLLL